METEFVIFFSSSISTEIRKKPVMLCLMFSFWAIKKSCSLLFYVFSSFLSVISMTLCLLLTPFAEIGSNSSSHVQDSVVFFFSSRMHTRAYYKMKNIACSTGSLNSHVLDFLRNKKQKNIYGK